ncbi:MAG: class I SAM-dependent methyltransferase [Gammaproteobacteria bacterium]|nr:class I SAM-dependent methyltransferase [Gammaproteobacteria bacterium]MDH3766854.1 class I SAM-dependent methyltransferase [Gammaproteobacteria bacterium]
MSFKDHFSGHAGDYARFRPGYPRSLFQWLSESVNTHDTVWDCGCGNGQASGQLAEYFQNVHATDASAEQIVNACGPGNVRFHTATAENSGLQNDSVDLICVAQALHWFNTQNFYEEAQRVGKQSAILAVWMYGQPKVEGACNEILAKFDELVGPYWPPERSWIDQGYANVRLPGRNIETRSFKMHVGWPLEFLSGYVGSWSATRRYRAATGHDPIPELEARLAQEWGDPRVSRAIIWPLIVLASHLNSDPIS